MGKPYNGFTSEDRTISSKLFRRRLKAGVYETPQKDHCEACLQTEGQIEWHREDYSVLDPEGIITICYRCHRVLHMRDRNPGTWDLYREFVRKGYQWYPTKALGTVVKENVNSIILRGAERINDPRESTVLDIVHTGEMLPGTPEERMALMEQIWKDWGKDRPSDAAPDEPLSLF